MQSTALTQPPAGGAFQGGGLLSSSYKSSLFSKGNNCEGQI